MKLWALCDFSEWKKKKKAPSIIFSKALFLDFVEKCHGFMKQRKGKFFLPQKNQEETQLLGELSPFCHNECSNAPVINKVRPDAPFLGIQKIPPALTAVATQILLGHFPPLGTSRAQLTNQCTCVNGLGLALAYLRGQIPQSCFLFEHFDTLWNFAHTFSWKKYVVNYKNSSKHSSRKPRVRRWKSPVLFLEPNTEQTWPLILSPHCVVTVS